mmetsp:Transcript_4682/g.12280  ORF Transcript_4682/g.12280 Transcript_4682/m.12280 type:complete len:174 (-) Transcript_4682:608-1129(-)
MLPLRPKIPPPAPPLASPSSACSTSPSSPSSAWSRPSLNGRDRRTTHPKYPRHLRQWFCSPPQPRLTLAPAFSGRETTSEHANAPVIDLNGSGEEWREQVVQQLRETIITDGAVAREDELHFGGAFYVRMPHLVSDHAVAKVYEQLSLFHAMPEDVKVRQCHSVFFLLCLEGH